MMVQAPPASQARSALASQARIAASARDAAISIVGVQQQHVHLIAVQCVVQRLETIQRRQFVVVAQIVRQVEGRQFIVGRFTEWVAFFTDHRSTWH